MHFVAKPLDSMARRPLALCAASLFAIASPVALATTYNVTSCQDDDSAGTLRYVISNLAVSDGDVVDFSTLTTGSPGCTSASTITLTTGMHGSHIVIPDNITIKGDPNHQWTVDGSSLYSGLTNYSNVFYHTGTGTLTVEYLDVTGGHESHNFSDAKGGCIYSSGGVVLIGSKVTGCTAYSLNATAKGGGVYAKNGVGLYGSGVYSNTATGPTALGGGVYSGGAVSLKYGATVALNTATGYATAKGGGIYAVGDVSSGYPAPTSSGLNTTLITNNDANATASPGAYAYGGGILSKGNVSLYQGVVKYNTVSAGSSGYNYGGGIFAAGDLIVSYTTVKQNSVAVAGGGPVSYATDNPTILPPTGGSGGGGIEAKGNVTLDSSTVSGNMAGGFAGVDAYSGSPTGKTLMVSNSTVSGNSAAFSTGGLFSNLATANFYNSTIAFNTAVSYQGVNLSDFGTGISALLQGTLMSNNVYGSAENDLHTNGTVMFDGTSSHNLVRATSASIPGNTLQGACPLLGPLRDNGGLTETHALLSGSPAIDQGNDVLAIGYDQRGQSAMNGTMDYPRPSGGADTVPDIGAYEVQKSDVVFDAGFDGCVPLM